MKFNKIFDSEKFDTPETHIRDKFMSRMFIIFSEEIVRIWCRSDRSPYIDLGRPTIKKKGDIAKGSTLDFVLQDKVTKLNYVSEMKCEIQYQNFKYLELKSYKELVHHYSKEAFQRFLLLAKNPSGLEVKVSGIGIDVEGAILIWGKTSTENSKIICEDKKFKARLSIEDMIIILPH